ncbi:MAG: lipid-A-disaccharide synthase N-terminal domain-containing protein [Planctomycetes bacterium]|nr:lipid-A-disaccharide synthase N-terminal domain-containing protein [Planctomycetota bacterium]MCA8935328.1 lipid-A-disaccharide synthase N-terminal domain-containing protein [Planctomycetota bacterium]
MPGTRGRNLLQTLLSLNPPEGKTILAVIGFAGQVLFTARILVQWFASEKAKKSVVPASFWWLSVFGTLLLGVYAWSTKDVIFILGPTVNLFLYVRNLLLMRPGAKPRRSLMLVLPLAAVVLFSGGVAVYFSAEDKHILEWIPSPFWAIVGLVGMGLWTLRFPVQWIVSERLGRSTLPPSFWWMSIAGAVLLTAYAMFKVDWVFMLAYALNPIPAIRNLMLTYRKPKEADTGSTDG